jgi:hypothetical protein
MTTSAATAQLHTDSRAWKFDAVHGLRATVDVETAGAILGIGRSKSYELAKAGQFPVRILRIGRRYPAPVPAILDLLGIDRRPPAGSGQANRPDVCLPSNQTVVW